MQNITLGHLLHEAADGMMVDEEDRKFMTNVIKRGALKDEVFLIAHTVGKAMAAKALVARHCTWRYRPLTTGSRSWQPSRNRSSRLTLLAEAGIPATAYRCA